MNDEKWLQKLLWLVIGAVLSVLIAAILSPVTDGLKSAFSSPQAHTVSSPTVTVSPSPGSKAPPPSQLKSADNIHNTWDFGTNIPINLIIAASIGLIAEFFVGWRLPFGIIGSIISALVGIWSMTLINIINFNFIIIAGVPIIRALVGAIIMVTFWHISTYSLWSRRRNYRRHV